MSSRCPTISTARQPKALGPSPEVIRKLAARIRKGWSREERLQRIFAAQQQQWSLSVVQRSPSTPRFISDN